MFDLTAFEIHWSNDACFKPCPTKTVINNLAEIQYPPLIENRLFCILCILFHF